MWFVAEFGSLTGVDMYDSPVCVCVLLFLKTPEWLIHKSKRYFIKMQMRIRYYFLAPVFSNCIDSRLG